MCGIAGIISSILSSEDLVEKALLMRKALGHRGPDDEGLYIDESVTLVHSRLSIIDLAGGQQPLCNETKSIYLVANGEIYNYKLLQKKLSSKGHHFKTESDSEVIIHLYEDEGERCVEHLEGMFAFALWDARHRLLLLARDRFGIKPLYIATEKNQVLFASELTAIHQSGLVKSEIDQQALYSYLTFSYIPGPFSIIKGIRKVRPSERIVVKKGFVQSDIYWSPRHLAVPKKKAMAIKELEGRLEESVRSHLVSDVPIGAFLSGGVDSSAVIANAQKHTKMETFCASFENTEVDESAVARRVADHLGTQHQEVKVKIDPLNLLYEAVNYMDEPFADSSALPTFAICRAAREVVKVVLSGDGGDEVFGGYTGRYRVAALKATIPKPDYIARKIRSLPPWKSGKRRSLPEMLELAAMNEKDRYIIERQITSSQDRAALFGYPQINEYEQKLRDIAEEPHKKSYYEHPVHRALWMDLMTSLADDMLTKVDRMSMAHGLEVRVPLLDHRLIEFSLSLPPHWLVSILPIEGKRILRRTVAPLLPKEVLNRPKHGFVVPLNTWLNAHFLTIFDDLCLGNNSYISGWLDHKVIQTLRRRPIEDSSRHDLYALLVLELWLRRMSL